MIVKHPIFDKEHPYSDLLKPKRYKIYYGGRGAAKSYMVAEAIIRIARETRTLILCTRQTQNSINDSLHRLLCETIERLGLESDFTICRDNITSKTGSVIIYKGIKHDINSIKSTFGVMICIVEEAQDVTENSWEVLVPTIREPNSEIWVLFNTGNIKDPTYQRFVVNPPPDSFVHKVNYDQNPYFPDTLRKEMEYMKETDYERYLHIWEGEPLELSDSVIFKNKFTIVDNIEESFYDIKYFGLDFGYSNDPTACIRCFIRDQDLYITHEGYAVGIENTELSEFVVSNLPDVKLFKILADSSLPATISQIKATGLNIEGAKKGPGSIIDGINFIRSFRNIYINSRCINTIKEFNTYKWKVDRLTNTITNIPEDKNNHILDSLRYSLSEVSNGAGIHIWELLGNNP